MFFSGAAASQIFSFRAVKAFVPDWSRVQQACNTWTSVKVDNQNHVTLRLALNPVQVYIAFKENLTRYLNTCLVHMS